MEITPDTTVEQIKLSVPGAEGILESLGIECSRCMGGGETLETAAALHNMPVDSLIDALKQNISTRNG